MAGQDDSPGRERAGAPRQRPPAGHHLLGGDDMKDSSSAAALKTCSRCRERRPRSDFGSNRSRPDGRQHQCNECRRAAEREATQQLSPDERRDQWLRKCYRMTLAEYDEMLLAQGSACAICRTEKPGGRHNVFVVDHDHSCCAGVITCGRCVRGLLCVNCNRQVGWLEGERASQLRAYIELAASKSSKGALLK